MSKPLAIICDIDETLCTELDRPIRAACQAIARLHRAIKVHYVTARRETARMVTEQFLCDLRLPGWQNLHLCPTWQSTHEHKLAVTSRLARDYSVIVSIGDAEEDERASRAAGVPFVRVAETNHEDAWRKVSELVERATEGVEDPPAGLFGS
jgi:hypothetical protein